MTYGNVFYIQLITHKTWLHNIVVEAGKNDNNIPCIEWFGGCRAELQVLWVWEMKWIGITVYTWKTISTEMIQGTSW